MTASLYDCLYVGAQVTEAQLQLFQDKQCVFVFVTGVILSLRLAYYMFGHTSKCLSTRCTSGEGNTVNNYISDCCVYLYRRFYPLLVCIIGDWTMASVAMAEADI